MLPRYVAFNFAQHLLRRAFVSPNRAPNALSICVPIIRISSCAAFVDPSHQRISFE